MDCWCYRPYIPWDIQGLDQFYLIYYYDMEKLLKLLNEFKGGKTFKFTGYDEKYWMFDTNLNADGNTSLPEETIICKKFWFIQWLVQNNKTKKIEYWLWYTSYSEWENLIRLLSIQDDPISFLISVLK